MENAKIQKFKCDILSDFQTLCLGGMWGIKLRHLERYMMISSFHLASPDLILYAMQNSHDHDQTFLLKYVIFLGKHYMIMIEMCCRYVWPWAIKNSICHDSYFCSDFPNTTPFPTQRKLEANNFVTAPPCFALVLSDICPTQCRPKNHQDWKLC